MYGEEELDGRSVSGLAPLYSLPGGAPEQPSVCDRLMRIESDLSWRLSTIQYVPPVEYVYNPLEYASDVHYNYLKLYCNSEKNIMFLGMNPGPWGMVQNGVPFGESTSVREFLQVNGTVYKPWKEHPARPVQGLACSRSEVSGKRFWRLASELGAGDPKAFFARSAVYNYCPLCFVDSTGKNVTPPELKGEVPKLLESYCDRALAEILCLLRVHIIIGIGRFAEKKAQNVVKQFMLHHIQVTFIPHPSPRNRSSNKDWVATSKQLILDQGLSQFFAI